MFIDNFYSFPLIFLSSRNSERHKEISNLAVFSSLSCSIQYVYTNSSSWEHATVFTRKYLILLLVCSRPSSFFPAFRSTFFVFSPFISLLANRPDFPQFISVANADRKRASRPNTLMSFSRWSNGDSLAFDPRWQNCNIAREEKADRGIGSLFSARIFARKKIADRNIDCGFETISISRKLLLDKQYISGLREKKRENI